MAFFRQNLELKITPAQHEHEAGELLIKSGVLLSDHNPIIWQGLLPFLPIHLTVYFDRKAKNEAQFRNTVDMIISILDLNLSLGADIRNSEISISRGSIRQLHK